MASNQTENYGLNQWERTDKVLMEDFNADNEKIDAAIKAVDARVDGKADTSALDALARTVSGHTTSLSKLGNCRIQYFTYTGTGTCGEESPTQIKFSVKPEFFIVMSMDSLFLMAKNAKYPLFLGKYEAVHYNLTLTNTAFEWQGSTAVLQSSDPVLQLNAQNNLYNVIAFFSQDGK